MILKFTKLKPEARIPEYKTPGSAGMDLYSTDEAIIEVGEVKLISTGLSMELPVEYEAQIRPRSGLSIKGITVMNSPGTIDSDYRGEVKIILANLGRESFKVNKMDRVAQMIIARVEQPTIQVVESLSDTERGTGGFGSTGV